MTRISDGTARGNVAYSVEFAIGHHQCECCRVETPDPPQSIIDELARKRDRPTTIWPNDHWEVPGWLSLRGYGWICDRCARAVMSLLAERKQGRKAGDQTDLAVVESAVRDAIRLADDGLRTDFPPPPDMFPGPIHRWKSPTRNVVFERREDYRESEIRDRIRQVRDALLCKPAEDQEA